jgi:hypothetical protein
LVEVLVTSSLVAIMGGLVFLSLHAGVYLFGKNIAVNLPYQASRAAFDVLQRDLHGSTAAPRLLDASLAAVSGPGPAAGVALRSYAGGPCVVASDAASTSTLVEIKQTAGFAPRAGDMISFPAFRIERNIISVTSSGTTWLLTLDAALGAALAGTASSNLVVFFTRRIGYVVVGDDLLRYSDLSQPSNFRLVSHGVTNATPFSFPVVAGLPDSRYLAVALTAHDPGNSAHQWQATDANLNFTIAYRATTPLTTQ